VGAPEEIEMDSMEVNIFKNPNYSFDAPSIMTESNTNEIELQRLQNQKLLKYSPSDNLTPQMEQDIDDMIARRFFE
jgi:hypothetical protein